MALEDVQKVISTPTFSVLAWTFVHPSSEFHAHQSRIDWFTDRHVQVLLTWSSKWIEAYGPFARGIVEPAHVGLWISHSWTDEHETHWKGVHRSKLKHRDFWCGYDLLDFFRSHTNTHTLLLSTLFFTMRVKWLFKVVRIVLVLLSASLRRSLYLVLCYLALLDVFAPTASTASTTTSSHQSFQSEYVQSRPNRPIKWLDLEEPALHVATW